MDQIEHVVLLILENRSFDSMLGWLYEHDKPLVNVPPLKPNERAFEGLQDLDLEKFRNTDDTGTISVLPMRGAQGLNVPNVAPGESYGQVVTQLFNIPNPCVAQPPGPNPDPAQVPTMTGYVRDYAAVLRSHGKTPEEVTRWAPQVMQSHTPEQLPVLNGLARHYAVCDHWFSSVPSQTNTNRAFAFCGTSMGMTDNGFLEQDPRREWAEKTFGFKLGDDRVDAKTIFNAFATDAGMSWKVFRESGMLQKSILTVAKPFDAFDSLKYLEELTSGDIQSDYVHRLFPQIQQIANADSHFAAEDNLDEFHRAARAGQLPNFTFIEPDWTIAEQGTGNESPLFGGAVGSVLYHQGNDYHPPGNLDAGEVLVKQVYQSLIANQQAWNKTLFIITFDEPVGSFDHVPPPQAMPPWGTGAKPDFPCENNFNFDRYGGRVPAILVSPLVEKGTVFRSCGPTPFDHTSLIATLLKWRKLDAQIPDFGARTVFAPTFEGLVSRTTPRTDAADIGFLQVSHQVGDPFQFYDRFYLRDAMGRYVSRFMEAAVLPGSPAPIDPTISEYFPTLAFADNSGDDRRTMFYSQNAANRPASGAPTAGTGLKLAALEDGLGAYNVLGEWGDSTDCYYFNDYIDGDGNAKQVWNIQKLNPDGQPFRFGDKVMLQNASYAPRCLVSNGGYVTTKSGVANSYWTIEPVPDQQPDSAVVTLGKTYCLKHVKSGLYLTTQLQGGTTKQYYPTLGNGQKITVTLAGAGDSMQAPQLGDGRIVTINSTESLGGYNQLGAWTGDTYLYYYTHNSDTAKQGWALSLASGSGFIRVGEPLRVVNTSFVEFMVPQKSGEVWYLSTSDEDNDATLWVLEPA